MEFASLIVPSDCSIVRNTVCSFDFVEGVVYVCTALED